MKKKISPREQHEINKINQEGLDRFGKNLFRKEKPLADEKKRIQERLDWNKTIDCAKKLDPWKVDRVKKMIDNPRYDRETIHLNEKVAGEYERFIEARIKKLRRK